MTARSVRIPSGRARPLRADLHLPGAPRGAVLVVHGFKGFKDWGFFPFVASALADRGLAALRVNLSGCGILEDGDRFDDPDGFERSTLARELEDIASSARFLAVETGLPLGLLGHSRGGGTAIVRAAEDPGVRALVTWAAIARADRFGPDAAAAWERGETVPVANARTGQVFHLRRDFWDDLTANRRRYDLPARAAEVAAPWLIVHGEADETVDPEEARILHDAARAGRAGARAAILVIPGASHTFGAVHPFAGAGPELATAVRATVDWFDLHLAEGAEGR